ncbi:autotransporter-associated beta strand protein [Haloferula luteola]|uniref:Autotransporter-associated beta strand protein n=1 Tax=Haloferula luteola TaxID=595692 RepID=A0A840V9D8_9BACT|nr:autotransporter-associated beta strand repeat-containing protein [Haloferula luteola]MBB5350570.1 autotransporter-associated beta strand protein [Haloferula luteola]
MRSSLLPTLFVLPTLCHAQIPAFPGAEGFGAYATGGRGGDVYYVTTLNNNGAGSLREALNTAPASGRTILFAVSGYIPVVSDTNFQVPSNVTIAGQSAPGDGVGLKGGRMLINGSNVIMRHFRIRHGKYGTGGDCLNIASSASSTMLDHISLMFSTDENFSFFNSSVNNFTMQYSNSTWGMERHNAGGLWDLQNGSCHHSLWAHHRTRNPKARPGGVLEWINNVTFHWRNEGFIMGDSETPANWKANVQGCYYISIDDADDGSTLKNTAFTKATVASNGIPNFSLHLDDTLFDNNDNGILDGTDRGYGIVSGSEFAPGDAVGSNRYYASDTPFSGASGSAAIAVDDALTGYKKVLSSAAPLRLDANYDAPLRDELDHLLKDSLVHQYSILVQKDGLTTGEDPTRTSNGEQLLADQFGITNNGFGTLNGTSPPSDADLDGMPDFWEVALNGKGSITYNAAGDDHNTVFTAAQLPNTFFPTGTPVGYTYLEEYLHFLAIPHASVAKNTTAAPSSQTVDLAKYTDGFTASPVYTLTQIRNGEVEQFASDGLTPQENGPIARFTPTTDFIGRAGFDFTVTDAEGSQWTQSFALLVSSSAAPRDIVWTAQTGNQWDNTSTNWTTSSGSSTQFNDGDSPLFDDRASTTLVTLAGSRLATSVTVTGSKNYQLSGDALAVTSTFTKASDTTLTLNTPVSAATGTYLNGGTTQINTGANLSGGPIRFTGGSTLIDNTGSNYLTLTPDIVVNTGAVGNLQLSPRITLTGSLSGGGTFNIHSPSTLGTEGRAYLDGASAGCTGTVHITGGATAPGNGGRIALRALSGDFNGFPSARVHLSGIDLYTQNYSGGNTYEFGQLTTDSSSRLQGAYNASGTTTLSVGHLGSDSEIAGIIQDGAASTTALSKYGTGTLTLSGTNTYTGTTAIYGGELRVLGSLAATQNYLGSGATLSGNGTVASLLTVQPSAILSPGNLPGEPGTLTTTGGIFLNPCELIFDLSSNPSSGNDEMVNTSGTLTFNSTGSNLGPQFDFHLIDGFLSAGTYTLIRGGDSTSAPGSPVFTHNLPGNTRQSFSLQRSGGGSSDTYVRLVVTGTSSDLTWTGTTSTWDIGTTTPWTGGAHADQHFYNLDRVHFTDSGLSRLVTLSGNLEPQSVEVSSTTGDYTFTGSGSLAGTAFLLKSGAGNLTLSNTTAHSHSGGTRITEGRLILGNATAGLGSGPIELSGGTLELPSTATFLDSPILVTQNSAIASSYSGSSTLINSDTSTLTSMGFPTLDLSEVVGILSLRGPMDTFSGTLQWGAGSGMLRLNAGTTAATDINHGSSHTHFALGTASGRLANRNGDLTAEIGALSGGSTTVLQGRQSGSGATATTYRIGALNLDTCFDGSITEAGDLAGLHLVKVGSARFCLGGISDFEGSIQVEEGTLATPGSVRIHGPTDVANDATLDLDGGTFATTGLHVASSGTLVGPGNLEGELTNDGLLTCTSGTLSVSGSIINNGIARLTSGAVLATGGEFLNNGILDLLTADGGLPANLVNQGTVIDSSGLRLTRFGISGNDFFLTLPTYEGHRYQLAWSSDLSADSWNLLDSPIEGDGSEKTFTHTGATSLGARFYHLVITP